MSAGIREPVVTSTPEVAGLIGPGPHKALFLDRDGVINVDHGYVHKPEQTEWVPGIFDLARAARAAGYVLVVVTNQAGIARGYYDEAQFRIYTRWVHARFEAEGAPLLATYFCPHHPQAGGNSGQICQCRKPAPGMLLAAASDFGLALDRSVLVGDMPTDIAAGKRAGLAWTCLLDSAKPARSFAAAALRLAGQGAVAKQ